MKPKYLVALVIKDKPPLAWDESRDLPTAKSQLDNEFQMYTLSEDSLGQ
jgi:hypothetical protein